MKQENLFRLLLALCLIFLSVRFISAALTQALSFDGAQVVQVAQNLVRHGLYATSFDGHTVFDQILSIGPSVILPTAAAFLLFGESTEAAQLVNAIYLILLVCSLAYFLVYCLKQSAILATLTLFLVLGTPKLFEYGLGLYGEGPMTFYLVLVAIFLHKFSETGKAKHLFVMGLFLGLAFFSKEIAIISAPALLLALVFEAWRREPGKVRLWGQAKLLLQGTGHVLVGFMLLIMSFAVYKLVSLGWPAYIQVLRERWGYIIHHPGLSETTRSLPEIIAKLDSHLIELTAYLGIHRSIVLLALLGLLAVFVFLLIVGFSSRPKWLSLRNDEVLRSPAIVFLYTLVLSLFGWWLLLAGLPWVRYINPAILLLPLCLVLPLGVGVKKLENGKRKALINLSRVALAVFALLLVVYGIFQLERTKSYHVSFVDTRDKVGFQRAGDFIAQLPADARVYGYGWWEAPVISFAADRQFYNLFTEPELYTPGPLHEVYFVYEFYAYYLDPGADQNILDQFENHLVYSDEDNKVFIYQLTARPLFSYPAFTEKDTANVGYFRMDFTEDDPALITRNVYIKEHNPSGKWAQHCSAYLLKYHGEKRLRIELGFPELQGSPADPIRLDVYINRELVSTFQFTEGGAQALDVPLYGVIGDTIDITLMTNAQYPIARTDRQLSLIVILLELVEY